MDLFKKVDNWIAGAEAGEDGLRFPGRPGTGACDLVLTARNVRVSGSGAAATVAWDDFAVASLPGAHDAAVGLTGLPDNGWCLGPWSIDDNGHASGASLLVAGRSAEATAELRRQQKTLGARLSRILTTGEAVALYRPRLATVWDQDVTLVNVLCRVLHERPGWRAALDDGARVERLASDLSARRYDARTTSRGLRQRTWEIAQAMTALGFVHEWYGRPLPDDRLAAADEIVPAVLEKVRASRYTRELDVDADDVRAMVDKYYLNVDPWPFAALVPD